MEDQLSHVLRFPPVQKTLLELGGREDPAPATQQILSWIYHPHEQVPAELIRQAGRLAIWQGSSRGHLYWKPEYRRFDFAHKLRKRAQRDAQKGGWLWTPLLDLYSTHNMYLRENKNQGDRWAQWKDQRLQKLAEWVRKQEAAEKIGQLLTFQAQDLHILVARYASPLDVELVRQLVIQEQETQPSLNPVLSAIGENPNLTRQGLAELARLIKHDPLYLVQWVLQHPRSTPSLENWVAQLLVEGGHQAHLDHFLEQKSLPTGGLSQLIAREADWDTLQRYIQQMDQPADDFIRVASQRFPRPVLKLLEDRARRLQGLVSRQGLQAYCVHDDPDIRRRGLRLIAQLEED